MPEPDDIYRGRDLSQWATEADRPLFDKAAEQVEKARSWTPEPDDYPPARAVVDMSHLSQSAYDEYRRDGNLAGLIRNALTSSEISAAAVGAAWLDEINMDPAGAQAAYDESRGSPGDDDA